MRTDYIALNCSKDEFTCIGIFRKIDLSKCFDTINHDLLLEMVRRVIRDKRVIQLIKRFLKGGIMKVCTLNRRVPDRYARWCGRTAENPPPPQSGA